MGRASKRDNKTIYQCSRERQNLTLEKAAEKLFVSPDRIARIESEKSLARPEEVLKMAEIYQDVTLCNMHCAQKCPIGKMYVPEITMYEVSQITVDLVHFLNVAQRKRNRLVEITRDGNISSEELKDFVEIQKKLELVSIATETLQLWCEEMRRSGKIDEDKYQMLMQNT